MLYISQFGKKPILDARCATFSPDLSGPQECGHCHLCSAAELKARKKAAG